MVILLNEAVRNMLNTIEMHIFLWILILDILSGTVKALLFNKNGNSNIGITGLVKHLLVLILVIVSYPYLLVMGLKSIATIFVYFYIAMYGISLIENLGEMGIPFPEFIKERILLLKDKTDKGEK